MALMARCDRCAREEEAPGTTIHFGLKSTPVLPTGWKRFGVVSALPPFVSGKPWELCPECVEAVTQFLANKLDPEPEPDAADTVLDRLSDELEARVNDKMLPTCAVCDEPIWWCTDSPRGWRHVRLAGAGFGHHHSATIK